jgi:hypothetical protein
MKTPPWLWIFLSAMSGVAVELGIGTLGHESWDSAAYWSVGLPSMIGAALVCGFFARRGAWAVGYAPFMAQAITMNIETSSDYSLLPLGLMLMGFMGLPAVAAAFAGAELRKRVLR